MLGLVMSTIGLLLFCGTRDTRNGRNGMAGFLYRASYGGRRPFGQGSRSFYSLGRRFLERSGIIGILELVLEKIFLVLLILIRRKVERSCDRVVQAEV